MKKKIILSTIILFVALGGFIAFNYRGVIKREAMVANKNIELVKDAVIPKPTQISANGIPTYHLIKTAFVPQAPEKNWDQPWQDACEEASLLIVNYFYKNQKPSIPEMKSKILDMIAYEDKQGWGYSINLDKMKQITDEHLGFSSEIISNPSIEDIKKYVSQNIPVVVPAAGKILFKENKFFNDGGPLYHALVIVGYDDSQNKFIVHDVGTQHGANFRYTYNLLMDSIHDLPPSGLERDILKGDKKILIIHKNK